MASPPALLHHIALAAVAATPVFARLSRLSQHPMAVRRSVLPPPA